MTKAQKRAALRVIKQGGFIRLKYYSDGESCVIGALALKAHVSWRTLERANCGGICSYPSIFKSIFSVFGLTDYQQLQLQRINDSSADAPIRLKRMTKFIEKLPTCK
jgi:hypothetical protein